MNRPARERKLGPTWVDLGFQLGYMAAYRLLRTYWRLRHPTTHGSLVALWCRGEVLLVRHSYVPYYSAPGGYLAGRETASEAALRELAEEVGLQASREALDLALETTHEWEGKRDHVTIFNLEVDQRPRLDLDYREVVEACWFAPEQVASLEVFPPLKRVIARRARASRPPRARVFEA